MSFDDFLFDLPQDLIAREPLADRDRARLLVLDRAAGTIQHAHVGDLPDILSERAGRLGERWHMVMNESRVVPSTLSVEDAGDRRRVAFGRDATTQRWMPLGDPRDVVHPRRAARNTSAAADLLAQANPYSMEQLLADDGQITLPRYLAHLEEVVKADPSPSPAFYNTVYARVSGSVAPPSGGINLSHGTLAKLAGDGVGQSRIVHHVGAVTFRHPTVDRLAEHAMAGERFAISQGAAQGIVDAKEGGRRILAVGTTSTRALEHVAAHGGLGRPGAATGRVGVADLFITPEHDFKLVDGLLTGLHAPRTTLFVLVCSLAGRELVLQAYEEAKAHGYRWYTLGDSMLVL
jgi:S-adenosylmethionine:tRNA ribosyltransferase-isomerase